MKILIFLSIISLFTACNTFHPEPQTENGRRTFEYCGGGLWGYLVPIGPREYETFWTRKSAGKPLMMVYLTFYSTEQDLGKTVLGLSFVISVKEDVKVQFPDSTISVQIDGSEAKIFKLNMNVTEDAMTVWQRYPDTKYKTTLLDHKSNTWSVAKRGSFFTFLTDDPITVQIPRQKVHKISTEPFSVTFDSAQYEQIYVQQPIMNIWPKDEPLKDATLTVRLPSFKINGIETPSQDFTFNTDFVRLRSAGFYGRCPAPGEIFRFKSIF